MICEINGFRAKPSRKKKFKCIFFTLRKWPFQHKIFLRGWKLNKTSIWGRHIVCKQRGVEDAVKKCQTIQKQTCQEVSHFHFICVMNK